jgi:hypothetical protein
MRNTIGVILMAGLLILAGSGCALLVVGGAAAAGAGGYAWYSGELKTSEAVSFEQAVSASQSALKDLGYSLTETEKDALHAKMTFRGAGDQKVVVTVNKQSSTVSEIRVRVGTFGDKTKSVGIMDKIKSKL